MSKISSFKLNGVSQADRQLNTFQPGYFRLEERDMDDMLVFAVNLSRRFNYYNQDNKPDGSWVHFFLTEPTILARYISTYDINSFIRKYDTIIGNLDLLLTIYELPPERNLYSAFGELMALFDDIIDAQENLNFYFHNTAASPKFRAIPEFGNVIGRYEEFHDEIENLGLLSTEIKSNFSINTNKAQRQNWVEDCKEVFSNLVQKNNILAAACKEFQVAGKEADFHEPHIGLFFTFLELYQELKNSMNKLAKQHLDFYYKKELDLKQHSVVPDKLYLQLSINPALSEFRLNKDEIVLAEFDGETNQLQFSTNEDIILNQARVTELKTLFKSEFYKLSTGDELKKINVMEYRVFCANNPVATAADFLDKEKNIPSWPVLGEDQSGMGQEMRTMDDADLGILIASPVFFAVDGARTYQVRFYITQDSYEMFDKYAVDYQNAENFGYKNASAGSGEIKAGDLNSNSSVFKERNVIIYEMLNKAFYVSITAPGGWVPLRNYRVSMESETKESKDSSKKNIGSSSYYMQLEFDLEQGEIPFSIYQPKIHGNEYTTKWPMLSILLNNGASYHPYSFLHHLRMSRITINLKVEGSAALQLRNNFGPLSPVSPFQVFGPQPEPGSYMDIRNTNIFNRYTKNFSIKLNWFDLPKNIDGFENYFLAYNADIKNDSFKIGVNRLIKGMPLQDQKDRPLLNMFSMNDRYLSEHTFLSDTSFSRINFENELFLLDESSSGLTNFTDGTVRIEFLKPKFGFGHQDYPIVFPAALMHNNGGMFGGVFRKKMAIPNPPYSPKLHAVTVNYELEYSMALTGEKNESGQTEPLCIWHYSSFGHRLLSSKNYLNASLIPFFEEKANLYIGLADVVKGRELNLLFQLDEHNYMPPENGDEPVSWFYLVKNEWIKFDSESLLADNTLKFIHTGIIKLKMPEDICTGNTILNPSYYWIKACCKTFICTKVKAVFTQVVQATRMIDDTIADSIGVSIDKGLIKDFKRKIPQVQSLVQPFYSTDGRAAESESDYYVRVSELLRNKQRLITSEDISLAVLNKFPEEIYKVICYNSKSTQYNYRPGPALQVVVLPLVKTDASSAWIKEPRVKISTIYNIKNYLADKISLIIGKDQFEVRNPDYETVKIVCSVVFKENKSMEISGENIEQLNNDLRRIISPWLSGAGAEINTEAVIYHSEILNFIKNRPYVKYVTAFTILHFYKSYKKKKNNVESWLIESAGTDLEITDEDYEAKVVDSAADGFLFLKTFLPGAIFVSAETHSINVIHESKFKEAPETGIRGLKIGSEFLVASTEKDTYYTGEDGKSNDKNSIDIFFNSK